MKPWWKQALTSWQVGLVSLVGTGAWLLDVPSIPEMIEGGFWDAWLAMLFGEWNRQTFFLILPLLSLLLLGIHIGFVLALDGGPYRDLWRWVRGWWWWVQYTRTQVGKVTIRYGVVERERTLTDAKSNPTITGVNSAELAESRKVRKGKIETLLFRVPILVDGKSLYGFLELPDIYRVIFPQAQPPHEWSEVFSKRPPMRQYVMGPLDRRAGDNTKSMAAVSVVVVTQAYGTGGWRAVWKAYHMHYGTPFSINWWKKRLSRWGIRRPS